MREAQEEAGIQGDCDILTLESKADIPAIGITDEHTRADTYTIPEYTFAIRLDNKKLTLSKEHIEYMWVGYDEAMSMLKWESNKNALCELNERLARRH